jgi:biotin synthase
MAVIFPLWYYLPDDFSTFPEGERLGPAWVYACLAAPKDCRMPLTLNPNMPLETIESWLRENDAPRLEHLWSEADRIRQAQVGDEVYFRGLIEVSSYCARQCLYCGLRGNRNDIERYRLTDAEIQDCAKRGKSMGYGTVVLQAGEDPGIPPERIARLVTWIKQETGLAVTLSLGEQSEDVFRLWKTAGADRYLLRIETTDDALMRTIHPGEPHGSRKDNIDRLFNLGFQVGSGVMVGIPGQTPAILARDLAWFRDKDFDMIGIGPFLPHPGTPLGQVGSGGSDQVLNSETNTHKALALTRVLCPEANLPATTALATVNRQDGRELALQRGANVVMPNLTPVQYRSLYEIYPSKACIHETAEMCQSCLGGRISSIGRKIGVGPGARKHGYV